MAEVKINRDRFEKLREQSDFEKVNADFGGCLICLYKNGKLIATAEHGNTIEEYIEF